MSDEPVLFSKRRITPADKSQLATELYRQLDESQQTAAKQFREGRRVSGWATFIRYAATFVSTFIAQGNCLRGQRGLIASSVAAQRASNQVAMVHCMSIREKCPR